MLKSGTLVSDLGDKPAVKQQVSRRTDFPPGHPDAGRKTERVPSGLFVKVVKPSGAVDRVPINNTRTRSDEGYDDAYGRWLQAGLWKTGSVPYDKCLQTLPYEITHGYLPPKWYHGEFPIVPEHLRGRIPCRTSAHVDENGQPFPISRAHCCACVEELIEYRKKWQAERAAASEVKTAEMLQAEASHGLVGAVKGLADVVADLKGKKREVSVDEEIE